MPAASCPRCCSSSEAVVQHLVDRRVGDDAYDSAHERCSSEAGRGEPRPAKNRACRPKPAADRASATARLAPTAGQGPNSATNPAWAGVVTPAMSANTTTSEQPARQHRISRPACGPRNPRPMARITPASKRARRWHRRPSRRSGSAANASACFATGAILSHPNIARDSAPAYAIAAMKPMIQVASAITSRMMPRTNANSADSATTATTAISNPFMRWRRAGASGATGETDASLRRRDDSAIPFALQRDARGVRFGARTVTADAHAPQRAARRVDRLDVRRRSRSSSACSRARSRPCRRQTRRAARQSHLGFSGAAVAVAAARLVAGSARSGSWRCSASASDGDALTCSAFGPRFSRRRSARFASLFGSPLGAAADATARLLRDGGRRRRATRPERRPSLRLARRDGDRFALRLRRRLRLACLARQSIDELALVDRRNLARKRRRRAGAVPFRAASAARSRRRAPRTIAPTRRRRALRFISSTRSSALSAMRSAYAMRAPESPRPAPPPRSGTIRKR